MSQPVNEPPAVPGTGQPPANQPPPNPVPPANQPPVAPVMNPAGYPEATPWKEMTPEQQVNYWQSMSRKHEGIANSRGNYDDLKVKAEQYDRITRENASDQQRAILDAQAKAAEDARALYLPQLVESAFKVAVGTRLTDAQLKTVLEPLDFSKFTDASGTVDSAKVTAYAATLGGGPQQQTGPNGQQIPDLGGGPRGGAKPKGVSAGEQMFSSQQKPQAAAQ